MFNLTRKCLTKTLVILLITVLLYSCNKENTDRTKIKNTNVIVNPTKKEICYAIIVGGGTFPSDVEKFETKWKQLSLKILIYDSLHMTSNLNKLLRVKSDTVEGMNPGFHIVVAGFCKYKENAKKVRDLINVFFKGTYIKEVRLEEHHIKHLKIASHNAYTPDYYLVNKQSLIKGQSWPKWYVYKKLTHNNGGEKVFSILIRLQINKEEYIDQFDLEGSYTYGGENNDRAVITYDFNKVVNIGSYNMLEIKEQHSYHFESGIKSLLAFNSKEICRVFSSTLDPTGHYFEHDKHQLAIQNNGEWDDFILEDVSMNENYDFKTTLYALTFDYDKLAFRNTEITIKDQ